MALEEAEIRRVAESIVKEAKRTAKKEQGTLFRSIAYTYIRGELIFRQIYYGVYYNNSQLEKLAQKNVPKGVPWKIILTTFEGGTYETGRTRTGRASKKTTVKLVRSLAGVTTSNIRALIAKRKAKKEKDGEKKN